MEYLKVEWLHNFTDEPIILYSELDENRQEVRTIELYRNGKVGYATKNMEYGGAGLSKTPLPEVREIAMDKQFKPCEITREEFDKVWSEKVGV